MKKTFVLIFAILLQVVTNNSFADDETFALPPIKKYPREEFYPPASRRLGATDNVVIEFNIDRKGRAQKLTASNFKDRTLALAAAEYVRSLLFAVPEDWVKSGHSFHRFVVTIEFKLSKNGKCVRTTDLIPPSVEKVTICGTEISPP